MRRILWTLAALSVAACALAQAGPGFTGAPTGATSIEMKCPLDDNAFRVPPGDMGDKAGGMDSDECWHPIESNPLQYYVIVCPRCNYAAPRDTFQTAVPDAKRADLRRLLAKSRWHDTPDTYTDIPLWDRFRLAAECAHVLGRAEDEIAALKAAVWSVRIEACRPATLDVSRPVKGRYGLPLPRAVTPLAQTINEYYSTTGVDEVIAELDKRIAEAAKVDEKHRLMLELAMMDERGGFSAKRDEALAKLAGTAAPDSAVAAPLARFRKLLAVEQGFQTQFVEVLKAHIEKEASRTVKAGDEYLLADTLRRLGRVPEAIAEYRNARKLMPSPNDARIYCDYFLTRLAPGEPLPAPEPPPAPETPKAPPAPETPKAETK